MLWRKGNGGRVLNRKSHFNVVVTEDCSITLIVSPEEPPKILVNNGKGTAMRYKQSDIFMGYELCEIKGSDGTISTF